MDIIVNIGRDPTSNRVLVPVRCFYDNRCYTHEVSGKLLSEAGSMEIRSKGKLIGFP